MNQNTKGANEIPKRNTILTMVTEEVYEKLLYPEITMAIDQVKERAFNWDSSDTDMWLIQVNNKELCAFFDEKDGPNGEDCLTLAFPAKMPKKRRYQRRT